MEFFSLKNPVKLRVIDGYMLVRLYQGDLSAS